MEQNNKKVIVSLRDIFLRYDGEVILNHINLDIHEKEFVTILGPSGCGKTTTLRIIGGFVEPESGDVIFDGKRINGLPPHKRNVNTVFQKYSLFPHLNVFDNVAFGSSFRAASSSASPLQERWCATPPSSCWTSRWARST